MVARRSWRWGLTWLSSIRVWSAPSPAEVEWLARLVQHARDLGIDPCDEDWVSGFFGVQLNAAGEGADLKVSVGVGSVRAWNSLILVR